MLPRLRSLVEAASVYADRRIAVLFFMGFASGLPLKLVFATLSLWLAESGINKATVGAFALVSLPYSFKILWAPLIDQTPLGALTRALGHRRAWMIVVQVLLVGAIVALALTDPFANPVATAVAAVVVAFLSASQDVVIDAYRVELLPQDRQGAGTATFVFGYRMAMLTAGAGVLHLVTSFEHALWLAELHHSYHGDPAAYAWASARDAWSFAYLAMAGVMALAATVTLVAPVPDPELERRRFDHRRTPREVFNNAIVEPFGDFIRRRGWPLILLFVFTFKLSDALAAVMTGVFLVETGFSNAEIANVRDTWGLVASLSGVAVGGLFVRALGVTRALRGAIAVMIASNLAFSWQAVVGHDVRWLVATIGIENLTGGFGTATFVAYLSSLCDRRFAATQYALLTSLSSLSGTLFGSFSGTIALAVGWPLFFALTGLASLPALLVDALRRRIDPVTGPIEESP